jgi:hypothetical protein
MTVRAGQWLLVLGLLGACASESATPSADRAVCDAVGPMIKAGPRIVDHYEDALKVEADVADVDTRTH